MRIALIGNPNSGKTTLFNELTGTNQHVGNWPGVTVEKKEGSIRPAYGEGQLVDLPGIYSLSPFTSEEVVSRDYLVYDKPDVVINIVDATNLERNLYLTIQLIELNVPLVIALNMMDEVEREGFRIDTKRLSHDLGAPIIPISAAKKIGLKDLLEALPSASLPKRHELPNPPLERLIALTEALLNEHLRREHLPIDESIEGYPLHWAAIKVLEGDDLVLAHITLDAETQQMIDGLKSAYEIEHGLLCTAFADSRYRYIHHVIHHGITIWSSDGSRHRHLRHAHQDFHHSQHNQHSQHDHHGSQTHSDPGLNDHQALRWRRHRHAAGGVEGMSEIAERPDSIEYLSDDHIVEDFEDYDDFKEFEEFEDYDDYEGDEGNGGGENADYADYDGYEDEDDGDEDDEGFPGAEDDELFDSAWHSDGSEYPHASNQLIFSDRIDHIVTHRIWAIPIFLVVIFIVFHLTFSESLFGVPGLPSPGVFLQSLVEAGLKALAAAISVFFKPGSWAESLVVNGIFGGVGTVLTFLPKILLLFLFLTLLEDCGYMARAAFIMDRALVRFGLSGKSFLPMLMGFGCTVPAAMACRTMENEQDRRLTLMLVPFISCGARAPIFLVFASAFFPQSADLVVFSMYLLGVLVAVFSGVFLRKLLFKGARTPFMIELPRYRLPRLRSVSLTLWDKLKDYLVRAGTVIFAMCVVIWFFSSFGFGADGFGMVAISDSLLAAFGGLIAPLFAPLGFGFWIAAVAILTGFVAKESVIGTLGVILIADEESAIGGSGLTSIILASAGFTPLAGLSFMVFCLLYIPCVAAFATLRREFGSMKWAIGQALYSITIAYVLAFLVYQIGNLVIG